MTIEKQLRPPLIVDPDYGFLDSLKNEVALFSKVSPVLVATGREAQLLLCDASTSYCGIFVSPKVAHPGGLSVIRCAKLNRPTLPIYVLEDSAPTFSDKEARQLGVEKTLQKPLTLEQIMSLIAPSALLINPLENAKKLRSGDKLDAEVSVEDSKFIPIRAADFLSGTTCFFDVYVRINASKYVKILQAGDQFQTGKVQSYLDKKVEFFYLKKESQEHYLSFCDQLSSALVKRTDVPIGLKLSQIMNHGEETLKFLQNYGISDTNIQYSLKFLQNVGELVKALKLENHSLLKGFLEDVISYEHGVGVATIASLLIPSLEITSVGPIETVGLGSLLHDIGLYKLGITSEDQSKMSTEELKRYKEHPFVGVEILNHLKGISSSAIQAVLQHHERGNRKGFPSQLGTGSISMVAEIIGISDEFFQILTQTKEADKTGTKFNFQYEMKTRILDAFSVKVVNEFKKIFLSTSGVK